MDLSSITFYAFSEMYSEIYRNLNDSERIKGSLDNARRELPLVEGMISLLSEIQKKPEGSEKEYLFNRVMYDINIVIALWQLERQESPTKPTPEIKSDDETKPNQLRLRRHGMN